jgi:hypothetical protein
VQTVFLSQYFYRMYIVGMWSKSALISAIYRSFNKPSWGHGFLKGMVLICNNVPTVPRKEFYFNRLKQCWGSGSGFNLVSGFENRKAYMALKKEELKTKFFAYYFLKVHLHHFSKIKCHKEKSQNSRNQCFSYYFAC